MESRLPVELLDEYWAALRVDDRMRLREIRSRVAPTADAECLTALALLDELNQLRIEIEEREE